MNRNEYTLDLLRGSISGSTTEYDIDDKFFEAIDGIITHGKLHTTVSVEGNANTRFRFQIHSEGVVFVPCDRCLADIEYPIDVTDELSVKLGEEFSDEGDVVIVPEREGTIDVSQFIYEFIALSLPLKLVHEPGKCDEAMIATLEEHLSARSSEDDEEQE